MVLAIPRISFPGVIILALAGISSALAGLYSALRVDEPMLFSLLERVLWYWAIGWWLTDDLRRRRESWIYCPGVFITAWPIWLPYYLLKTRGPRALIAIAVCLAIMLAALVIGVAIGVLIA